MGIENLHILTDPDAVDQDHQVRRKEHMSELNITPEVAAQLEGKKLPVTIDVNGMKQTIGEATCSVVDGEVHFNASIKKGFEGLVKPDLRHFSLVDTDYREISG